MTTPTKEQLNKINKFSKKDLKAEQVYTFNSLSADTLPIKRFGWYGEYSIEMTKDMLEKLKKDYRTGVGLLASHNSSRLPFGRTYDADVQVDTVNGEEVNTLYIDQYMVKYMEDGEGNKSPMRTEVNGLTTEDIANHIDAGHAFDTSIGFSMDKVTCSICKHDIRDWEKCKHSPGGHYEVQVGDKTEKVRCNILAESGEGVENSIVYAGAVNRAIIQNQKEGSGSENLSQNSNDYAPSVNLGEGSIYNVDDLKNVPLHATLTCNFTKSKGSMEIFADTLERRDFNEFMKSEESATMSEVNKATEPTQLSAPTVSQDLYDQLKLAHDGHAENLNKVTEELQKTASKVVELQDELKQKDATITELTAKAALADEYRNSLVEDTVKAAVAARGNQLNQERFTKYVETLSLDELKEELAALKQEATGTVEAARVTQQETEDRQPEAPNAELSLAEIRTEAARLAMVEYNRSGGDLVALTEEKTKELRTKHGK